jgi:hypothetical protein
MSLFYKQYAVPSRMVALLKFLSGQSGGRCRREVLIQSLSPPSLGNPDMITETVGLAEEWGLVSIDDEKGPTSLNLAPEARAAFAKGYDQQRVRILLARAICHRDERAAKALAWLLGQDPLVLDGSHDAVSKALRRAGDPDALGLSNSTTYGQLVHWAVYAGLCWRSAGGCVFDPTSHLSWVLPTYFADQDNNGLPINAVCEAIGRAWPIYPGGSWYSEIERLGLLSPREPQVLAPALFVSFARLRERGWLGMSRLSDAGGKVLPDGRITHLQWRGPKARGRQKE